MRPNINDSVSFDDPSFDDLISGEDVRFVEIKGVQYAYYCGNKFKNCGYMRLKGDSTKKQAKASKYDLVSV